MFSSKRATRRHSTNESSSSRGFYSSLWCWDPCQNGDRRGYTNAEALDLDLQLITSPRSPGSPKSVAVSPWGRIECSSPPVRLSLQRSRSNDSAEYASSLVREEDSNGNLQDPDRPAWVERLRPYVLVPGSARARAFLETWDLYIVFLVVLVAYYEPYVLALYGPRRQPFYHKFINSALTISFTFDMLLQFFTALPNSEASLKSDLWETDVRKLATHYVSLPSGQGKGWFILDIITLAPGWISAAYRHWPIKSNPLLFVRILRIFQSARRRRLSRMVEMAHSRYGFSLYLVEVFKFMFLATLTCHWIACAWVLVEGKITPTFIIYEGDGETWLSDLIDTKGDSCVPDAAHDPVCVYLIAYYWAAMTLTSVGYGDITPQNKIEYWVSVMCMFVAGFVWAYIVGSIVSILSNLDPVAAEFQHCLDSLGELMHRRGFPEPLKMRLRSYMYETKHFMQLNQQSSLVEQYFSDGLQRDIARNSVEAKRILQSVFWVQGLEEDAVLDIVRGLRPKGFGPGEIINMRGAMILVQRGVAGVRGRVLSRGHIWGHCDILLESPQLIDSTMPQTLSFVELLQLARGTLIEVCRNYPHADRRLRRAQIRTAVMRAFVYAARRMAKKSNSYTSLGGRFRREKSMSTYLLNGLDIVRGGAESSFVNPGMRRVAYHRQDSEREQPTLASLRSMLDEVLERQDLLQAQVADALGAINQGVAVHRSETDSGARHMMQRILGHSQSGVAHQPSTSKFKLPSVLPRHISKSAGKLSEESADVDIEEVENSPSFLSMLRQKSMRGHSPHRQNVSATGSGTASASAANTNSQSSLPPTHAMSSAPSEDQESVNVPSSLLDPLHSEHSEPKAKDKAGTN